MAVSLEELGKTFDEETLKRLHKEVDEELATDERDRMIDELIGKISLETPEATVRNILQEEMLR